MLRKNLGQKNEDKIQSRRMFDWFKNLFGLKHNADAIPVKQVNRTGIEQKIEKTEENILESLDRIADAIEKISTNINIQLHMMVPIDKDFDINTRHDSTRESDRFIRNTNKTEEALEGNAPDEQATIDLMEPIYRIASSIEKISNNMELQLHMMLSKKDTGKNSKHTARNSRRNTFEWMYNLIFGNNTTDPPPSARGNTTLYDLLTKPYGQNAEGDILEAIDRVGFALERINTNLELQLHMKLDCKCEEQTRVKRKYEIHKRNTRMARNFYETLKSLEDNKSLKNSNVRRKRDVEKNDTDFEVSKNKLSENSVGPLAKIIDVPDDDTKTTKVPLAMTTETVLEKKENSKTARRQDAEGVKFKLLNYIYESFNEITNKIDPLSKLKTQYQNENLYKIGYIMSNIDTLEVNLRNIKKDVDGNKEKFEESKILNVLDTFMASNRIVTSLIDSLKLLDKPVDITNLHQQTTNNPVLILN